jgi:hypothetical protein
MDGRYNDAVSLDCIANPSGSEILMDRFWSNVGSAGETARKQWPVLPESAMVETVCAEAASDEGDLKTK